MEVIKELECREWNSSILKDTQVQAIQALESGKIIHCPHLQFELFSHEKKFLSSNYSGKNAKNISFNSHTNLLSNVTCNSQEYDEMKSMIKRFSENAYVLVRELFPQYTKSLKIGRTSFRPVEIAGRKSSYRKDDTRLHVDAFPSSPNQGWRILRVFTNINPNGKNREWRVGEPFSDIAKRFLPKVRRPWPGSAEVLKLFKITKSYRTLYDHIMLTIHDSMKADMHYQKTSPQKAISFAPGTTWIVQTDHVSHAAMSGQHLLEQTFYLPVNAMMDPALSPLRVLEKLTGKDLTSR